MRILMACIVLAVMIMTCIPAAAESPVEPAAWMPEFQRLCSHTDQGAELTVGDLDRLIAGCDELLQTLAALDEPRKKVYIVRLTKCRDLYVFTKEIKTREK